MATENVTVLFTDLVGSTALSSSLAQDAADELRRRKTDERKQALNSAGTDETIDGPNVAETMLMLNKTRACFARLPEDQRLALALVVLDGRSYREAADQLEIPIGTLMSRLSRGRDALRRMIEQGQTTTEALQANRT